MAADRRIRVAHVLHRLDVGGLENGVINVINGLGTHEFAHEIVSMTTASSFASRLAVPVPIHCMLKQPGQDPAVYWRLWRLFRRMRPDIVHTRNLSTLEAQLPALLSGVGYRVHGEHGRDVHDLDNQRVRYRRLRAAFRPLVHRYVTVSRELEAYLRDDVGVRARKIERICNGVDTDKFKPRADAERSAFFQGAPFDAAGRTIIGTVGRLMEVKDQLTLAHAYCALLDSEPRYRATTALVLVGDGPLRAPIERLIAGTPAAALVWLPGTRDDVPVVLNAIDLFVLPSLAEGISNTILEAMASGLAVVATAVGGNHELVQDGETGTLVPRRDSAAMAAALAAYLRDPARRQAHARAGRERVLAHFSLPGMIARYGQLYRRDHTAAVADDHP